MRLAAAFALTLAATVALPQMGGRINRSELPLRAVMAECLQDLDVQEALRLDLKQRLRLRSLPGAPPASPSVDPGKLATPAARVLSGMEGSLRREQRLRLRQLAVRRIGILGPVQREVARDLGLSEAQKATLQKMAASIRERVRLTFRNAPQPPPRGADSFARFSYWGQQRQWSAASYRKAIGTRFQGLSGMIAALRPEQRKRWKALVGLPLAERILHPAATLEADMRRRSGAKPGDNPAVAEARLRMQTPQEKAELRRECLRRAGAAALLFPEVAEGLHVEVGTAEQIYSRLLGAVIGDGPRPVPESFLTPEQTRRWRAMIAP